jgi:protein-arginine kinase activator protein McsA
MIGLFNLLNFFNEPKPDLSGYNREITEYETESHKVIIEKWISDCGKNSFLKKREILKENFLKLDYLENQLSEAVENQDYEMAAKFRDEINNLKKP